MSMKDFKDAILEVAEEMYAEAVDIKGIGQEAVAYGLQSYAKRLRSICKAAGDDPAPVQSLNQDPNLQSMLLPPEVYHRTQIEKAKEEFRKGRNGVKLEERFDGDMVEVVGGPANPDNMSTVQSINPDMPIGAYMELSGGVYQLRKGTDGIKRLEYDEIQTKTRKTQLEQRIITA